MLPFQEEHLTRLHEGERFKSNGARLRGGLWVLALALASCGDSDSAPPPGAGPEWKSAFADKGGRCAGDKASLDSLAKVTVGDTTLFVGFEQTSADNQDPLIARYDGDRRVYCVHHENDGPDGRAVGLTWNGGEYAYVVYTVVGGGSDLEGKQGWLGAYAPGAIRGGGPKVSYVGRVNVTTGALETGTFIIAVKSDNSVNSHGPRGPVSLREDGTVEFSGDSAHKPIDADGQRAMACTDYPFTTRYRFSADLKTLVCADSTQCTSQRPCTP